MKTTLALIFSCISLKNGKTYFKNLAVFTPHDFQSIFGHFSTLCMRRLSKIIELLEVTKMKVRKRSTQQVIICFKLDIKNLANCKPATLLKKAPVRRLSVDFIVTFTLLSFSIYCFFNFKLSAVKLITETKLL